MIRQHGTDEQKQHFLPKMATGEVRVPSPCPRPDLGSDVAAIKTRAKRDGNEYVIDGAKMWLTKRRQLQPDRAAGQDRRGRREALPEPDRVPGGEAVRLR